MLLIFVTKNEQVLVHEIQKKTLAPLCKPVKTTTNIFHKNREISILMMKKKQQG